MTSDDGASGAGPLRGAVAVALAGRPPAPHTAWLSPRALALHLAVAVWVPGCGVAAWWQVTIAMSGNSLGWVYAVEWPVFAVLGVVGWWQLIHDDPETVRARRAPRRQRAAGTEAAKVMDVDPAAGGGIDIEAIHEAETTDDELAAYNAYLARLAAAGRAKTWRDPTGSARR